MKASMTMGNLLFVIIHFLVIFGKFDHQASQYDPHIYPSTGPFCEGWYARLTDTDNERSFGVLFGRVLPSQSDSSSSTSPTTYIGILRSNGTNSPLVVAEAYPNEDDIKVTARGGRRPSEEPNLKEPSYFEWVAHPYGFFNVTHNSTVFNFTIDRVSFAGNFSSPLVWDSTGQGPEGWLTSLPMLPIHWFVYSLGTPGRYTWAETDLVLSGEAHAHQEKNWGQGFPEGWMWTQAYNRTANATFAGSFGMLSFVDLAPSVPAHLFGYRNFARNIIVDFRPDNSYVTQDPRPCEGKAKVYIYSPFYHVEITMTAPFETFQKCLRGPVETGFRFNLVETYVATIRVVIKKLSFRGYTVIEDQMFYGAAYEFGGEYLCHQNPCTV